MRKEKFFIVAIFIPRVNVLSIDPEMSTTQTMSAGRLPFALRPSGVGRTDTSTKVFPSSLT